MSDDPHAELRRSRARLGGLKSYGNTPDPEVLAEAKRSHATLRIECEIQNAVAEWGRLDAERTARIVALLLSEAGVTYATATQIENTVRASVAEAQR